MSQCDKSIYDAITCFVYFLSVVYRRIPDDEKPLALCLSWGAQKDSNNPTFALKENEDGKVEVCKTYDVTL